MFAASARHTNAGIALKKGFAPPRALPLTSIRDQQRKAIDAARVRLDAARRVKELLEAHPNQVSPAQAILARIAKEHGLTVDMLKGPSRTAHVVIARHHAVYEIRRQCKDVSTTVIGRMLGGRDHTTIITALRHWPQKAAKLGVECIPLETR